MIPKRVTLENFLSFGPKTEIAFADDEPLWVLGGPNGVGKSAVFDAITFCLFGAHRGGAKEIDPLVRHGSNGFTVSFEFGFGDTDYRITRSRAGNRTTQAVEQKRKEESQWSRVPNINNISDVKAWTERTLGLGFEAFKASVLLRQGEADAIIMATGSERLKILKKIIGVEPFEDLSKRLHEAARVKAGERERAVQRRDQSEDVKEADLSVAREAAATAEANRSDTEAARAAAAERVSLAKQWAALADRYRQLTRQIEAADQRAAEAEQIRGAKARHDELTALLPIASKLVPLRDAAAAAGRRLATAQEEAARALAERDKLVVRCEELRTQVGGHQDGAKDFASKAKDGRSGLTRLERFLAAAQSVGAIEKQVQDFDRKHEKLDEEIKAVEKKHTAAVAEERQILDRKAEAGARLTQAEREHKQIESVEVGVKCSRCGQVVTAKHAAAERKRLAEQIAELTTWQREASRQAQEATDSLRAFEAEKKRLTQAEIERANLRQRLADQRQTLTALGITSDLTQLQAEVKRLEKEIAEFERQCDRESKAFLTVDEELKRAQAALNKKIAESDRHAGEAEKLQKAAIANVATVETLTAQLPETWQTVTREQLEVRSGELETLKKSRIDERFQKLQEDEARRDEWAKQLEATEAERSAIPETARVPLTEAEQLEATAREAFNAADCHLQAARDALTELTRKAAEHERLKREIEAAEREARIHEKLDDLLGKTGLQRELVRGAETKIVNLANETMHRLDGDLTIELDRADDSVDEAFALRVRATDDPTPTGVAYLSGSQKFRVAISVALAIGRFAAGQTRPLESVIIDEGFGSLDKDGLKAAAEELNRLKQYMRRIILVSHQEDFTDHFPVVIRLSKGEHGTLAEAVRR